MASFVLSLSIKDENSVNRIELVRFHAHIVSAVSDPYSCSAN